MPSDTLAPYSHLGAGTIAVEDYVKPNVKLDYVGDGSYSGFDRFGRVADQKWYDYVASAVRDQCTGQHRFWNRPHEVPGGCGERRAGAEWTGVGDAGCVRIH